MVQLAGTIVCSNAAQLTSLTPFWIVIIYCILCMCYVVYYIGQEMSINLSNYNSTNLRSTFGHSGMPFILKRTFQFSPFFWQIDFPPPSEVPPPFFQFYRELEIKPCGLKFKNSRCLSLELYNNIKSEKLNFWYIATME